MNEKSIGETRVKNNLIILLCWLVYAIAYLGRYSYVANINFIRESYLVNRSQAGAVTTFFFFSYGAGQIIHGIFCKKYPKKLIISFALICSAIINLIVFLDIDFKYIKYLWLLNGVFQSILWTTLIKILSMNLKGENLSKAIVVMSSTVPVGVFLTYGLSFVFTFLNVEKTIFLVSALSMIVVSIIWFFSYKKAVRGEKDLQSQREEPIQKSNAKLSKSIIFTIVCLCLFAVANNLIKEGLTSWVPAILKENFNLDDSLSILLTLVLPLLGMLGAVFNVKMNKKINSFVYLAGIWFAISFIFLFVISLFLKTNLWFIVLIAFGIISLCMHGANSVITGIAPLYMREDCDSGLIAGILNGCCYVGSAISSYGLGLIADSKDWSGVFDFLLNVNMIPIIVVFILLIYYKSKFLKVKK